MRKVLLGTTAIFGAIALSQAAVAQTSAPITVTLGGSQTFMGGIVDEDLDTNTREQFFEADTSVVVGADGVASNGLKYGARIELMEDALDEDAPTERYAYISGDNWGRIEAGNVVGASRRLAVYAPSDFATGGVTGQYTDVVSTTFGGNQFFFSGIDSISGVYTMYRNFDSHDALKISYFSPRVAGFQFGATYAPDGNSGNNFGTTNFRTDKIAAGDSSSQGLLNRTGFSNYHEVGINYAQDYSGVGVAAAVTYVGASAKNSSGFEDLSSYNAGLSLSTAGFTVGGGYVFQGDSGYNTGAANNDDAEGWNVGLQYETGPFIIGANALFAENEGAQGNAQNNDLTAYSFGTTYKIAEGLSTFVEATFFEYDGVDGGGTSRTNDGSVVLVGTAVEF